MSNAGRDSIAQVLGALGPGGMVSVDFHDFKHAYGMAPDEPDFDGEETIADIAREHGCTHEIDHEKKKLHFWKK